jgi:hypothetical protein
VSGPAAASGAPADIASLVVAVIVRPFGMQTTGTSYVQAGTPNLNKAAKTSKNAFGALCQRGSVVRVGNMPFLFVSFSFFHLCPPCLCFFVFFFPFLPLFLNCPCI